MELQFLPIILFLVLAGESFGHQQLLNVIPTTGGLGQTVYSTIPVGGQQFVTTQAGTVQPSVIQLVRQPGIGLTQFAGGQPGLSQVQLVGGGGLPLISTVPGVGVGVNGLTTAGYPYGATNIGLAGTTTTNLNGVPVILSGASGVSLLGNGLQVPTQVIQQQPLVSLNPVVRQVPEVEEAAAVVELDPMDAALLDMENKGQIHMEKYAWGRSSLAEKEKAEKENSNADRERKADLPMYLSPVPNAGIVSTPVIANNRYVPSPTRTRNPFIGEGGKRKKHFEHYEYFRNLDMNPYQIYVPMMTVVPPKSETPNSSPSA